MINIAEMFRSVLPSPSAPVATGTPTTPGNIPPGTGTDNNPPAPQNATVNADGTPIVAKVENPLDAFKDLWKTEAPKEGEQPPASILNVDAAKLMETVGKIDFNKSVTPEIRAAIAKGGEEGVTASMQAINLAIQQSFSQSLLAATKITERALAEQQSKFDAALPGLIKRHNVSDTLRNENPAFSHPAVQPLISALEDRLTIKHHDATAAEINTMAKEYLAASLGQLVPAAKVENTTDGKNGMAAKEVDWEKFLAM